MADAGETFEEFPFRYRDPRTGMWVRARYKASRDEIAARYAEWELPGARCGGRCALFQTASRAGGLTPQRRALRRTLISDPR